MPFFLFGCAAMHDWRKGMTNLTERGTGSVPFAWREGLAAHILSRLWAAMRFKVDRSWRGQAIFSYM